MPTISEIQSYLVKTQKSEEDPITDKSKARVTRQMAESVKKITPLSKGRCNICSTETERLVPATMEVCIACANKFIKRGSGLKVIKKEAKDTHCDNCLVRTFTIFLVNPLMCHKCSRTIARTHKYGTKEMNNEIKKEDQEKAKWKQ